MSRRYRYVGPAALAAEARAAIDRLQPRSPEELRRWLLLRGRDTIDLTYIVDVSGALWLSDRQTEHVACARGGDVLAAGEIALRVRGDEIVVAAVSNQSTGYCPEPECWPAVRAALERAGLRPPSGFANELRFRRCERCGAINIIKDDWWECGSCEAELPRAWNFDRRAESG